MNADSAMVYETYTLNGTQVQEQYTSESFKSTLKNEQSQLLTGRHLHE